MSTKSNSLALRVARERHAADETELYENVRQMRRRFHHVFACPAARRADDWHDRLLDALVPGASVLDYGCYEGENGLLDRKPGELIGVDISETAIAEANERFGHLASYHVADAHDLSLFPRNRFDVVVGSGILHHLDLPTAVGEIWRVLRPGGSAVFIEPLGENPASKLWRRMTPGARTADERPLDRRSLRAMDARFSAQAHFFSSITSAPVGVLTSLTGGSADNPLLKLCDGVDEALRRTPLKWWARAVYIHWIK